MSTVVVEPAIAAHTVDAVKVYGRGQTEVRALDGVTVEFEAHRFTAIMGPSGSGKSTLLHCVAGLDTLTSGQAFIGDDDLSTLDDRHLTVLRRDEVGFVFQAYNLVPTLTALENITLPLRLAGHKGDKTWIDTVVEDDGPVRPPGAPPVRTIRWAAATRGGGPGARDPTADHLR